MKATSVLQSLKQGILICDSRGKIIFFNEAYGELIGEKLELIRGQSILKFRHHALAPQVLKTGEPVEGVIRREGNQEYFASVYPIIEDGRIFGCISIVTTLVSHQLKTSAKELTLEERVRRFEKQEIQAEVDLQGGGVEGKKRAAEKLGISLSTLYNKLKEQ